MKANKASQQLSRRLYIKTYGCQMNSFDSSRMIDMLSAPGFIVSDRPDDADIILLNTCYIREKSTEKVFSELGRLHAARKSKPAIIVVTGCIAQVNGEEILKRAPYVNVILGPQTYHKLSELITQESHIISIVENGFLPESKFDFLPPIIADNVTASIAVQEGCNKFCTFCVVPYTRGIEYSRPAAIIISDIYQMIITGAKNTTLLGQNINAYNSVNPYGNITWRIEQILKALAKICTTNRLCFLTSHPSNVNNNLSFIFRDVQELMPYLHLPVQSGSDRILAAMNRGYTVLEYRRLIDRLRHIYPSIALSSDFIVGFPGETDMDFDATLDLVQDVTYTHGYAFKFSPRPGTAAATVSNQVPESIKERRLSKLQKILSTQQEVFNRGFMGRILTVLLDHHGIYPYQLAGYSTYRQVVTVTATDNFLGRTVSLRVNQIRHNSLNGVLLTSSEF